jgi:phosphoribosylamine--glycine ligase
MPYTGFLYAGLMIDAGRQPKTLEFNCRMGDPETQPIMMRLKTDLVDLVEAAVTASSKDIEAEWDRRVALGVVMAAAGYPESPRKGDAIHGLPPPARTTTTSSMPAPTALPAGRHGGGRVLCVTALGDNVGRADARLRVADQIQFDGMQFRRDIGHRAIAALQRARASLIDDRPRRRRRQAPTFSTLQARIVAGLKPSTASPSAATAGNAPGGGGSPA